jgi:glycine betaine/proline transport system substrate-binding protein
MDPWKKILVIVGSLGLTQVPGLACAQDHIVIGVTSPPYAVAIANIIKVVAEQNLGIKVNLVPGSTPVIYKAMAEGKGDVDVHPATWLPNSQGLVDQYVTRDKTVALTDVGYEVRQGLCTTHEAREKYGLKSVYDLAKPEIVALTDPSHTGKGVMMLGDPSWNSIAIDTERAKGYGLIDLYDLQTQSEDVMLASATTAVKTHKIVVFSCDNTMIALFNKGDLALLDEPAHDPGKWHPILKSQDPNWLEKASVSTSWPVATGHLAYSVKLKTSVPDAARLLDHIHFNMDTLDGWIHAVATEKQDPEQMAKNWVAANKQTVSGWLAP